MRQDQEETNIHVVIRNQKGQAKEYQNRITHVINGIFNMILKYFMGTDGTWKKGDNVNRTDCKYIFVRKVCRKGEYYDIIMEDRSKLNMPNQLYLGSLED